MSEKGRPLPAIYDRPVELLQQLIPFDTTSPSLPAGCFIIPVAAVEG